MGDWKAVVPVYTKNLITNSSFGLNIAGWATGGINTIAQSTAQQFYGDQSLLCTYQNSGELAIYAVTLTAAAHSLQARVFIPSAWDGSNLTLAFVLFAGATGTLSVALDMSIVDQWQYIEVPNVVIAGGDLVGELRLRHTAVDATAGRLVYLDAVQCEAKAYATTCCDGDQHGCEWLGAPHASMSQRSAVSRAGGRVLDLKDDYGFGVVTEIGTGVSPHIPQVIEHATLPGGQVDDVQIPPRPFTLSGVLKGSGASCDLRAARQSLWSLLNPKGVPKDRYGVQPVRFRYTGAAVDKEIAAIYEGGLGANIGPNQQIHEKVALRLLAKDPFWYEVGESAAQLDTTDTATLRYITGRLRSTGQWDDLGLTNNPGAGGTIFAAKYNPHDGRIYVGGNFTDFNQTGTGIDYAVVYDPATDTWTRLGGANAVNGQVNAIAIAASGDVYYGGFFTDLGGVTGDYVAYWDISAGIWVPVAGGGTAEVRALAFGLDGTLFIGGNFNNWDTIGADFSVKYPVGGPYTLMQVGQFNSTVDALAIHPSGDVYTGGSFTHFGAVLANYWARYDGSAYNVIDTSLDGAVLEIVVNSAGVVFIGGAFTTPDSYVTSWTGQQFVSLGTGTNNAVHSLAIGPDGMLYVGGLFTIAGGITLAHQAAKWNGSSWAHLDVTLTGGTIVYAIETGTVDPVVPQNYDVYLGFNSTGAVTLAGATTVTNDGTVDAYPVLVVERDGGTSAVVESLRNEVIGKELLLDYGLLDGERLVVDLTPTRKSVVSNFFGAVPNAVLKNSDFGQWLLKPGDNDVTCFINVAGAPTMTAYLLWKDTYGGND